MSRELDRRVSMAACPVHVQQERDREPDQYDTGCCPVMEGGDTRLFIGDS